MAEMETVLLQIYNEKAYKLIQDLEDLQIVKVLKKKKEIGKKPSERFAGSLNLTEEEYDNLQNSLLRG